MSKIKVVKVESYGKLTKNAIQTHFISHNGSFNLKNVDISKLIAIEILKNVSFFCSVKEADILNAINEKKELIFEDKLPGFQFTVTFRLHWEGDWLRLEEKRSGIYQLTDYYIEEYNEEDIEYMVVENFLSPKKGIPSVLRMYHMPFDNETMALEYMKQMKKYPDSVKELHIVLKEENRSSVWFREQMEANVLMSKYGVNSLHKSFRIMTDEHIENLITLLEKTSCMSFDEIKNQVNKKVNYCLGL